ncbi:C39 family peptidase [Oscillospiraceae bacterium 50-16]|nr:hypothetical protein [Lawsonibacter sp.]
MKIKRITSMFLALVLLFTTNQTVLAVNVNSNDSTSIQQLYILSKQCPEQYIDYAKEIVGDILAGYNLSNASLGRPFTFSSQKSDIYYFPIYSNHKIVLTFRVYLGSTGELTGVVSPFLAEDLNEIAKMTTISNPLRITFEGKDSDSSSVIFKLANDKKEVFTIPVSTEIDTTYTISAESELETVNCVPFDQIQLAPSSRTSKILPMSISETQGANNWCLAYATAMVLRYRGVNKNALNVMIENYGVEGEDFTDRTVFDFHKLRSYMNTRYNIHTKESERWPDYNSFYTKLVSEINNNRPLILAMNDLAAISGHALVALGYEDVRGTVTIWNPWNPFFETVIDLNNYIVERPDRVVFHYSLALYWYNNY